MDIQYVLIYQFNKMVFLNPSLKVSLTILLGEIGFSEGICKHLYWSLQYFFHLVFHNECKKYHMSREEGNSEL